MLHYKKTEFGFEVGSVEITRTCSDHKKGWVALSLKTPKGIFDIYVTKTGKVRFHSKDGEWFLNKEIK